MKATFDALLTFSLLASGTSAWSHTQASEAKSSVFSSANATSSSSTSPSCGHKYAGTGNVTYDVICGQTFHGQVISAATSQRRRSSWDFLWRRNANVATSASSLEACIATCDSTQSCNAAVVSSGSCTLYSSITGVRESVGAEAAVRAEYVAEVFSSWSSAGLSMITAKTSPPVVATHSSHIPLASKLAPHFVSVHEEKHTKRAAAPAKSTTKSSSTTKKTTTTSKKTTTTTHKTTTTTHKTTTTTHKTTTTTSSKKPTTTSSTKKTTTTTSSKKPTTTTTTMKKTTTTTKAPTTTTTSTKTTTTATTTKKTTTTTTSKKATTTSKSSTVQVAENVVSTTSSISSAATGAYTKNTGKRGLAYNNATLTDYFSRAGQSSEVSWAYNWYLAEDSSTFNPALTYIPMLYNNDATLVSEWPDAAQEAIDNGATALMSFNEPDWCASGSACMSVELAVETYQTYMQPFAGCADLGAPAVTNAGYPYGLTYLEWFIGNCTGCTIDYINLHWYSNVYAGATYFEEYINSARAIANGRPIWITEFGLNDEYTYTDDQLQEFLETVMPWMDQQSDITHYAYFMDAVGILINDEGTGLSDTGAVYNSFSNSSTQSNLY